MASRDLFRIGVATAVLGGTLLGVAPTAEAQYFGRNKVQYEDFNFEILRTDHFDIYYYPEEEQAVELAAIMAERWYARLSRILNHDLSNRQVLILYASSPHFRQTNTLAGDIGEGTGGVTEILKRRIVLPFTGPLPETDHVLGHELVHAFQFDITGEGGGVILAGVPSVMRFPLWFVEGMAEYLSIGPRDPNTAMWMRDAVREELPDFRKLSDPRYFPYRYGHSLWSYIAGRWGDDVVGRVLKASRTSQSPESAFARVLRMPADSVVLAWHESLREYYEPLADMTRRPGDYGRPLVTKETGGGQVNIAPALSPDGSRLVFLSERDLFSIDMYLADAVTGDVIRKVTRTAVDAHFESLQFINSAGAWDAAGRRFVIGAIARGRPILSITDMETGGVVREIDLPELGEVYNPTWSPDGRYVAFSGLVGGLSDLFTYDLEADQLRRLTNDGYADLQPAWSPDGGAIVFVTDRFSTGLSSLLYGNYRLALIDPGSGAVRPLPAFQEGKHINPQWSPESESVYFISDRNGISNVYRVEVATGDLTQVTNLYAGVSGITSLSPALSIAAETGAMAFTAYEEDLHAIYLAEDTTVLAGGEVFQPFGGIDPAALPPAERLTNDVAGLVANAFYGLPTDTTDYTRRPYRSRFALDYIGQPSLAIGADRFGTYIAGGGSLFWSDMLGNHNLATALQVQGSLKDIAALVGYSNLTRRLNWTVSAQQIPYLYAFGGLGFDPNVGYIEQIQLIRQTNRSVAAQLAYPLSRAQRIEGSVGLLHQSYDREDRVTFLNLGQDTTIHYPSCGDVAAGTGPCAPEPISLGIASTALVYDNSIFGVASPLLGQRYRIEFGTNIGTIDFHQALFDYRRYFMPVRPFTLAMRVLHTGRYGSGSESSGRLQPMFIGYDGLVRGYEYGSFDFAPIDQGGECESAVSCPAYSQLFGPKIAVANLELRFPPLGLLGIGSGLFGFLPLEAVVFGDAGMAWYGADPESTGVSGSRFSSPGFDDRAFFLGGERRPIYSAGAGLRMNVFGFAIIEMDYVVPFSRERGGHLQFSFVPGF